MTDCLFCGIARGDIPADVVESDDLCVAFRDIHPAAPVHVLVVPREHIATIDDVETRHEETMGRLFRMASKVAEREKLKERGYRVVMNCGKEAGQSVFHVHLHVLGGKALGWPPFPA